MKLSYFKHFTSAHEGSSLMTLFDEFGHAGPCCYWIMVELCAGKLEKESGALYSEADCVFRFHERILREKFRLSSAKVQAWLNQCQTMALLSFQKNGAVFEISMPKLLESLDRDSKRARPERGRGAPRIENRENENKESSSYDSEASLLREIPEATHARWRSLYPDPKFVSAQITKAWGYYSAADRTLPPSIGDWDRVLSKWLDRNWPFHVKANPGIALRSANNFWKETARKLIMSASRHSNDSNLIEAFGEHWAAPIRKLGGIERLGRLNLSDDNISQLAIDLKTAWDDTAGKEATA